MQDHNTDSFSNFCIDIQYKKLATVYITYMTTVDCMFRWGQSMKISVKATSERQYTLDRYTDAGKFSLVSGDAIYRYLYKQL